VGWGAGSSSARVAARSRGHRSLKDLGRAGWGRGCRGSGGGGGEAYRQAVKLVLEQEAAGLEPGVHTYTALIALFASEGLGEYSCVTPKCPLSSSLVPRYSDAAAHGPVTELQASPASVAQARTP